MLKIKDNVDLKELEKFGFVKNNKSYNYNWKGFVVMFVHEDRRIYKYLDGYTDPDYDVLFDLIQAGLVEKVEVKE